MDLKKVSEGKNREKLSRRVTLRVEVIFGNPHMGCRGSGICQVTTKAAWKPNLEEASSSRRVSAYLVARAGRLLELKFPLKALHEVDLEACLQQDTFEIPVEVSLPGTVRRGLRLKNTVAIAAGAYPLHRRKGSIVLVLGTD